MSFSPRLIGISAALVASSLSFAAPAPNPQMKAVLRELKLLDGKPIETLSPAEARRQPSVADAAREIVRARTGSFKPEPVAEVRDIELDGAAGKLPARIYAPEAKKQPLPVVVYFHGGGFVIATIDTYDATPRALVNLADAIVVSVEYRKGPEHQFPAAHDDAFAAYLWVLKNAASFGGDPARVAVAGESAGANLALNVAIEARDRGERLPMHELLVYPVAGDNLDTRSYRENAQAKPLNKAMMEWFIRNYTRSPKDARDPRLNLVAAELHGLPSATVITAQIDPLRSEGRALADRLKASGVSVDYQNYRGVTHEFFGLSAVVDEAVAAQRLAADDLVKAFGK